MTIERFEEIIKNNEFDDKKICYLVNRERFSNTKFPTIVTTIFEGTVQEFFNDNFLSQSGVYKDLVENYKNGDKEQLNYLFEVAFNKTVEDLTENEFKSFTVLDCKYDIAADYQTLEEATELEYRFAEENSLDINELDFSPIHDYIKETVDTYGLVEEEELTFAIDNFSFNAGVIGKEYSKKVILSSIDGIDDYIQEEIKNYLKENYKTLKEDNKTIYHSKDCEFETIEEIKNHYHENHSLIKAYEIALANEWDIALWLERTGNEFLVRRIENGNIISSGLSLDDIRDKLNGENLYFVDYVKTLQQGNGIDIEELDEIMKERLNNFFQKFYVGLEEFAGEIYDKIQIDNYKEYRNEVLEKLEEITVGYGFNQKGACNRDGHLTSYDYYFNTLEEAERKYKIISDCGYGNTLYGICRVTAANEFIHEELEMERGLYYSGLKEHIENLKSWDKFASEKQIERLEKTAENMGKMENQEKQISNYIAKAENGSKVYIYENDKDTNISRYAHIFKLGENITDITNIKGEYLDNKKMEIVLQGKGIIELNHQKDGISTSYNKNGSIAFKTLYKNDKIVFQAQFEPLKAMDKETKLTKITFENKIEIKATYKNGELENVVGMKKDKFKEISKNLTNNEKESIEQVKNTRKRNIEIPKIEKSNDGIER